MHRFPQTSWSWTPQKWPATNKTFCDSCVFYYTLLTRDKTQQNLISDAIRAALTTVLRLPWCLQATAHVIAHATAHATARATALARDSHRHHLFNQCQKVESVLFFSTCKHTATYTEKPKNKNKTTVTLMEVKTKGEVCMASPVNQRPTRALNKCTHINLSSPLLKSLWC